MIHAKGATVLAGYLKLLPLWIMVFPGMAARKITINCHFKTLLYKTDSYVYTLLNKTSTELHFHSFGIFCCLASRVERTYIVGGNLLQDQPP